MKKKNHHRNADKHKKTSSEANFISDFSELAHSKGANISGIAVASVGNLHNFMLPSSVAQSSSVGQNVGHANKFAYPLGAYNHIGMYDFNNI